MNNTSNERERVSDPQITTTGTLKESGKSDVIVFSFMMAIIEIVCIVTVPNEGSKFAPVYIKFRIKP